MLLALFNFPPFIRRHDIPVRGDFPFGFFFFVEIVMRPSERKESQILRMLLNFRAKVTRLSGLVRHDGGVMRFLSHCCVKMEIVSKRAN